MFGFLKKGLGKGGNTLILLGLFLGIGFLLHFKDRFFPEEKLSEALKVVSSGSIGDKIDLLSQLPLEKKSAGIVTVDDDTPLEEILHRRDFLYPGNSERDNLELVEHQGFSLGYSERYEQASWVAYPLVREQVSGQGQRDRFFNPDPKVKTGSALFSDYTRSGYDRGHLAPAADFKHSYEQMRETFYMSNISPQNREFNAGIWNDLEKLVRVWANRYEKIYVVTGPVLKPGLKTIGKVNKVAVPQQFYKIVLYAKPPYLKGIAFLLNNEPSSIPLSKTVVSIDSVENLTGIDFFPLLPDDIEDRIEMKSNPGDWFRLK